MVHPAARLFIQPKLKVNDSGDAFERESDRVAEQVTRTSEPRLQPPKVDVVVPNGWGRQPVNPAAKVEVLDTAAIEREKAEADRQLKVSELRRLFQEYQEDYAYQTDVFGQPLSPNWFGGPAYAQSDDKILALEGDKFFFQWMQKRRRKSEWQSFQAQARAMGYEDDAGIKEMWKNYRREARARNGTSTCTATLQFEMFGGAK